MQMDSMHVQAGVLQALQGSAGIMKTVNENMNVSDIQNVVKQFQKESMKAEMN